MNTKFAADLNQLISKFIPSAHFEATRDEHNNKFITFALKKILNREPTVDDFRKIIAVRPDDRSNTSYLMFEGMIISKTVYHSNLEGENKGYEFIPCGGLDVKN